MGQRAECGSFEGFYQSTVCYSHSNVVIKNIKGDIMQLCFSLVIVKGSLVFWFYLLT